MRVHEVQPGDSPAEIAILYAGCPKCARDLVLENKHKATVAHPNGFVSFESLHVGEKLNLPDKWFNGDLDARPRSYFAALPSSDGVTPSSLGDAAAGVLSDYAALDTANAKVSALSTMSDQPFNAAVNDAADAVDASVREASGTGSPAVYAAPFAQDARNSTSAARQRNVDLTAAISADNQDAGFQARDDIMHDLSAAMVSARLALQAFYGDPPPQVTPVETTPETAGFPTNVVEAANATADAIAADASYCSSVAHSGTPVNVAVHAFKTAWNVAQTPRVPINTGKYEKATAEALARVLSAAPTACGTVSQPTTPATPSPSSLLAATPQKLSTGAILGIGLLGAGAVSGVIYLAKQRRRQ